MKGRGIAFVDVEVTLAVASDRLNVITQAARDDVN